MGMFDDLIPAGGVAPAAGGMFDDLIPQKKDGVSADVAKSFATGALLKQPASILGAPRDVANIVTGPMMEGALSAANQVRSLLGMAPVAPTAEQRQGARDVGAAMTPNLGLGGSADVQKIVENNITGEWHKPQTMPGQFAQTIGEFTGPAAMPSKAVRNAPSVGNAVRGYVSDLLGGVVAPAVTSETAGQLTQGSALEPVARIAGALAGNLGYATARAYNAPDMAVRRATRGTTPEQWDAAAAAQRGNATGIQATGPEYLAQATDGASPITDLLRVVEGSMDGRAKTGPFFAQRPGQVDAAVGNTLDQIAPQSANPSGIAPAVSGAASRAMSATPEGQALVDAIFNTGPRTTPMQAGAEIQGPLRQIFDRRSGMRDAIGDAEYTAARAAEPRIPVSGIQPETVRAERPVYSIKPTAADEATGTPAAMAPVRTDKLPEPVAMESLTGPSAIQADPRPFMRHIDEALVHEKGPTADALSQIRQGVMGPNGVDTSVTGLDNLRGAMNARIAAAKQAGDGHTAEKLLLAQKELDRVLESVPEYAKARTGFQAGSAPLEPFQNPAVSRVIERDQFDRNFTTNPENVPGALEAGGPTAARAFNDVAPVNSRVAYENYLSTKIMDAATDANGAVNPERLQIALRDNQDLLSQYPAVAERLAAVPQADANMAGVRAGPLGRVANATTTPGAGAAILPQNPMVGSGPETADAVARLVAQDGPNTAALVRQTLGDRYARASTETQNMNREFGGANFRRDVAGNAPKQEVLDAVLGQMPNPAAGPSMEELLNVLQTTGRRKQIGSQTEFNRQIASDLAEPGAVGAGVGVAASAGTGSALPSMLMFRDAMRRNAMRGNMESLADMFLDPQSVELMRNAANRGLQVNTGEALARTGLQVAPMFGRQDFQR